MKVSAVVLLPMLLVGEAAMTSPGERGEESTSRHLQSEPGGDNGDGVPNEPPVANDDTVVTEPNKGLLINVLKNDYDPENEPLTVEFVQPPQSGDVALLPGNTVYFHNNTDVGTDTFTYRVSDGEQYSNVATVTVHVWPAPVANDDTAMTAVDTPIAINLLANDIIYEYGDQSTISLDSLPGNGEVSISTGEVVEYVPSSGFVGPDSFTYHISDGMQYSNDATVTVHVRPAPVANNDAATTAVDTPVIINLLANDVIYGDKSTIFLDSQPGNSKVSISTGELPIYVPNLGYTGTDSFTYHISDGLDSNVATVTVSVGDAVPPPPPPPDGVVTPPPPVAMPPPPSDNTGGDEVPSCDGDSCSSGSGSNEEGSSSGSEDGNRRLLRGGMKAGAAVSAA